MISKADVIRKFPFRLTNEQVIQLLAFFDGEKGTILRLSLTMEQQEEAKLGTAVWVISKIISGTGEGYLSNARTKTFLA